MAQVADCGYILMIMTPNIELLTTLIYNAIEDEETSPRDLHAKNPCERADDQLLSVAVAPELAIGYLVRRQALNKNIPLKSEVRYTTKGNVDLCLVDANKQVCVACELKMGWLKNTKKW